MCCSDADCKYPNCDCWEIKIRNDPVHLKRILRRWIDWHEMYATGLPGSSELVELTMDIIGN